MFITVRRPALYMKSRPMKGNINMIIPAVFAVMMIGILVAMSVLFLTGFMDATTNAVAITAINDTINAIIGFVTWLGLIVTTVVIVVLLTLVFMIYRFQGMMGRA